jgi:hypothetical protein
MKSLFWPHKYRNMANWFIAAGIMLFYFYYKGYRPDFLDLKTFAFASTFLEKKFLVFIQNNMLDEIAFVELNPR